MDSPNFTPLPDYFKKNQVKSIATFVSKSDDAYRNVLKNEHLLVEFRMWEKTFFFSLGLLILNFFYLYIQTRRFNIYLYNKAFATTSVILVGLSFALSGICYFWNFADKKIIYRKYLGIVGFFYGLLHGGVSFFLLPGPSPLSYYLSREHILPFLSGFLALLIFLMMTLISNRYSIQHLGGRLWKNLMHLGYIAYFFVIIHIILLNLGGWKNILSGLYLITLIFALLVIGLRIGLYLKTKKQTRD